MRLRRGLAWSRSQLAYSLAEPLLGEASVRERGSGQRDFVFFTGVMAGCSNHECNVALLYCMYLFVLLPSPHLRLILV